MSVYFYMRINSDDDWDEKKYFRQEKKLRSFAEKNEYAFNTEGDERTKNVFKDNCPGTSFDRKGWQELNGHLCKGDCLFIKDISRFTTDTFNGQNMFMQLYDKGVKIVFLENPTADTEYLINLIETAKSLGVFHGSEPENMMSLLVFAAIDRALNERVFFQQKVLEGMETSGKKPGREKRGYEKLTPALEAEIVRCIIGKNIKTRNDLMMQYDVSKITLSNYFKYVKTKLKLQ